MTHTVTNDDLELVEGIFERVSADLGMILDRDVLIRDARAERARTRVAGRDRIHIAFRIRVEVDGGASFGCLLVGLPDAIAMACYLMMVSEERIPALRESTELDASMKEGLLELGNFIAGAVDAVLRRSLPDDAVVRSDGCQGVRADVRPALPYEEGDELVVGRGTLVVNEFEPAEVILMLPRLPIRA